MTEVLDYLDDLLEAAEKIKRYTDEMTYEAFTEDERTVDAVLRNFEVMGEVAKNIPEEYREEYDEIAGMRDKLIHGYATIELEIVWTTVERDIPGLIPQLKRVRADLETE